ncbi:MAG: phosphatase PAP2 family protein [Calditrichaeota bacterium]|nr:phosphatase PAP2 family protein [Calditrichota bacterium]
MLGRKNRCLVNSFVFVFCLFLSTNASAKVPSVDPHLSLFQPSIIKSDTKDFLTVGKSIACAPLQFHRNQWIELSGIVATTGLLFQLDSAVRKFALDRQNPTNDFIFNADHFYGNGFTVLGVMGLYGTGYLLKNDKIRLLGLHAAEAGGYAGAITVALKIWLGRRRPYGGDTPFYFKPFQVNNLYNSLPSGHTTMAFAISTVLAKSSSNRLWKAFWYSAATLVAASRVYHNQHWVSDVFLGAAIGYSVGRFVIHLNP